MSIPSFGVARPARFVIRSSLWRPFRWVRSLFARKAGRPLAYEEFDPRKQEPGSPRNATPHHMIAAGARGEIFNVLLK